MKKTIRIPALYIHIPFCQERCIYCTFYTLKINSNSMDALCENYFFFLKKELDIYAQEELFDKNIFKSVFIGGGTPSLVPSNYWLDFFKYLREKFKIHEKAEITIEVHPNSLSKELLITYKEVGINRISMGCQTFNDEILKNINRLGSKKDILLKYQWIREAGFDNVNLDLIFGLWQQNQKSYANDLKIISQLNPDHISCYGLMTYKKSLSVSKNLDLPDEKFYKKNYLLTIEHLENSGFYHYEISNFAKKNKQCKHNKYYWFQKNYLGLGPSAVGTIENLRYKNIKNLSFYQKKLENHEKPIFNSEFLHENIKWQEKIMLGLRYKKGINMNNMHWLSDENRNNFEDKIKKYQKYGFLNCKDNQITMTQLGFTVYDEIISELI